MGYLFYLETTKKCYFCFGIFRTVSFIGLPALAPAPLVSCPHIPVGTNLLQPDQVPPSTPPPIFQSSHLALSKSQVQWPPVDSQVLISHHQL